MTSHIGFQARNAARCSRVVFAAAVLFGCLQSVAFAAGPVGLWYAEGGAAEVEIRPCSDALCGKIVWLRSPIGDDGCELRDDKNPDPAARARTIVGLEILRGLRQLDEEGRQWAGGTIYDPTGGRDLLMQRSARRR